MNHNIAIESISDSSDSEEELRTWRRISKKPEQKVRKSSPDSGNGKASLTGTVVEPATIAVTIPSTSSSSLVSSSTGIGTKTVHKPVQIITIDDSSDDSDSDDMRPSSALTVESDSGALSQLLNITQRPPKPQHANLIARPRHGPVHVMPPRHPTLVDSDQKSVSAVDNVSDKPSTRRVSPTMSGMSATSHQSAKQRGLYIWRRRMWPSLATFYRILLRCHCKYSPPPPSAHLSLTPSALDDLNVYSEMLSGDMSLEWGSFWDPTALQPLPVHFSSVADHNRQMFLLLLEECRFSMSTSITRQPRLHRSGIGGAKHQHHQAPDKEIRWQRGEVKLVTENLRDSLSSMLPSASIGKTDPRLGNLWILQVQLLPPKRSRSESELSSASTNGDKTNGYQVEKSRVVPQQESASAAYSRERSNSCNNLYGDTVEGYRPGELLVCRNQSWGNRLALGVVQGYDPDYDILLSTPNDDSQFTTVQLLVCVDSDGHGETIDEKEPSGWIDQPNMPLCQGTILQLAVIGNIVTSLRESQAISSLASLRPPLRELILCRPDFSYEGMNINNIQKKSGSNGQQKLICPVGVSSKLWNALSMKYNNSQLQAITSVVDLPRSIYESTTAGSDNIRSANLSSSGQGKDGGSYPFILLQGPPGTGKTSTIMGIISVLLEAGVPSDSPQQQGKKISVGSSLTGVASKTVPVKSQGHSPSTPCSTKKARILLCAPSNTAVDELVYRLKKYGVLGQDGKCRRNLSVVRIGQPLDTFEAASSTESAVIDVREFTLDYLVDKKRREFEDTQQSGYRRLRIPNTLQLRHQVLEQSDIVCCTLSGSGSPQLLEAIINNGASENLTGTKGRVESNSSGDGTNSILPFRFDVVIIDEAAQAVEPSALIPLKYNPKVLIMVGDACQLRATVLSKDATRYNFGQSLFERLDSAGYPKQMLLTQYRMHPDIALFPSKRFYEGKLSNDWRMNPTAKSKGSHWRDFHDDRSRRLRPMVFHNVNQGREELAGLSYCNHAEAKYIVELYGYLLHHYPNSYSGGVGIITGYQAQKHLLIRLFKQRFGFNWKLGGRPNKNSSQRGGTVEISTVDGFQGREKDVIIFSCVRSSSTQSQNSNIRSNIGFMNDNQRLNVALTRAKYGLWIVGDVHTMAKSGRGTNSVWHDLVEHCKAKRYIYEPSRVKR